MQNQNYHQLTYLLALHSIKGMGINKFYKLQEIFSNLSELFNSSENYLKKIGLSEKLIKQILNFNWKTVERSLNWLDKSNNHHCICITDENYPSLLKEISQAPILLFAKGNIKVLKMPKLAIVGSRIPTTIGKNNAYDFAYHLAKNGFSIVSGLAIGIDATAHAGALAGNSTIAVAGSGLNNLYPRENIKLAEKITENGLLLSEFNLDTPPYASNFPRRNRIISGLSLGVLVIEATIGSGSLISAKYALEQNREVFAIPGSIHNPMAKGCHQLIKNGAKLVENSNDIASELYNYITYKNENTNKEINNKFQKSIKIKKDSIINLPLPCQKILQCLKQQVMTLDELLLHVTNDIQLLNNYLLQLELKKLIQKTTSGYSIL